MAFCWLTQKPSKDFECRLVLSVGKSAVGTQVLAQMNGGWLETIREDAKWGWFNKNRLGIPDVGRIGSEKVSIAHSCLQRHVLGHIHLRKNTAEAFALSLG